MQIDGVDTAMVATITGAAQIQATFVGVISGTAGQYITIKQVISGGTATAAGSFRFSSMLETPNNILTMGFSNGNGASNSARTWCFPMGQYNLAWLGTEGTGDRMYLPGAYTLKSIYALVNAATGAGKKWTFSFYQNAADVAATRFDLGGAGVTSANIQNLSVAGVATDHFEFSALPTGTPTSFSQITITTEWVPAVAGESIMSAAPITVSGSATTFFQTIHPGIVGSTAAETTMRYILPPNTEFFCKDYRVVCTAPGAGGSGKTRTFTLRKNSGAGNNSILVSETATTGTDLTHQDKFVGLDYISNQCAVASTPASAAVNYYNTVWMPPNPIISSS